MKYLPGVTGILALLAIFRLDPIDAQSETHFMSTYLLSSCTNTGTNTDLPNLSYARKNSDIMLPLITCDTVTSYPTFTSYIDWYYYTTFPKTCTPSGSCCPDVARSIINYTSSNFADTPGGSVGVSEGIITDGPLTGETLRRTITLIGVAATACCSVTGLESRSGTIVLTVTNGPTCTGIATEEYCPGAKYSTIDLCPTK